MLLQLRARSTLLACLVAAAPAWLATGVGAQGGYLRGKVEEKNVLRPSRPATPDASREFADPFSGGGNSPDEAAVANPYPAGASTVPGDSFSGSRPPPNPPGSRKDPDASPQMEVAWDAWHQRVAKALFQRFNAMAKMAFKYSPPLACKVGYTVTREGTVKNIRVLEPSTDVSFDVLVTTALKSISGDKDLLQFPLGSHRAEVERTGTFSQNYGVEGFRYGGGDRETVRAKGKQ